MFLPKTALPRQKHSTLCLLLQPATTYETPLPKIFFSLDRLLITSSLDTPPFLSKAKRGFVCKIRLYKVFNYILHRLHTGCQWDQIAIDPDPRNSEKKKSVAMRCIITTASGHAMAA
jgi:hypothetical protein